MAGDHQRRRAVAQRLIGPLVMTAFGATMICAAIGYGLARQSDDLFEAERRAALHGAVEEFRAGLADLTLSRARELATLSAAGAARSSDETAQVLTPPQRSRYGYDRALIIGAGGEVAATWPADDPTVAAVAPRAIALLRDQQGIMLSAAGARGYTDFLPLHGGPALVALAPLGHGGGRAATLVTIAGLSPQLVDRLEQSAGLKDLSFGTEPVPDHQVRSVLDRQGRIIGWFSWAAERPMTTGMQRLSPLIAVVVVCLLGFSGLALWHLHRTARQLGQSEAWARQLAHEDLLTGVGSQRHLHVLLDQALASRRPGESVMLAHFDIDGFKEVNDLVGPRGGDQLLVEFADRLRKALPDGSFVARLGGDEFVALLTTEEPVAAVHAVESALASLMAPYWLDQSIAIRVSVGMGRAPGDGDSRDEVMRRAELALRAAKQVGGGQAKSFAPGMETELQDRALIKRDLTRAIADQALELYYQPIVTADGARVIGVEALLRWFHPTRGEVPPSQFVAVAEETGQMGRLGEFVLRRALIDAARWPSLFVCVNLSPVQVRDRELVSLVDRALAETRIKPSRLVLEITEGVLMRDPEQAKARLEALRALGVRIALDDFGAGYSSLSYLQKFPFDKLKIDRGFVTALGKAGNANVIIQAIVALGRALGVSVLVEGVETEEQRVLLRLAGCDEMQGFLFARPAPADAIAQLLTRTGRGETSRASA